MDIEFLHKGQRVAYHSSSYTIFPRVGDFISLSLPVEGKDGKREKKPFRFRIYAICWVFNDWHLVKPYAQISLCDPAEWSDYKDE